MTEETPKQQLAAFVGKYDPAIAASTKKVLAAMRKRLPGFLELAYDNYNALAIGFAPTEKTSDVVFSIAVYPRWVSLFFFDAGKLKDPKKLLKGSGAKIRHVVLSEGEKTLASSDVQALVAQALGSTKAPAGQKSRIIIKSISAKQRPRRT